MNRWLYSRIGWLFGAMSGILFTHLWWRSADIGEFSGEYVVAWTGALGAAWNIHLLILFYGAHSLFASQYFKKRFRRPEELQRKAFLAATFATVAYMWVYWAPLRAPVLWHVQGAASLIFYLVQTIGLIGLAWTYRQFDLDVFFGATRESSSQKLTLAGPFALCRHPSYFFGILLLCSPFMPLGRAVFGASVIVYIILGSKLEEKKLVAQFGKTYLLYRKATPWLVPSPRSLKRVYDARATKNSRLRKQYRT